MTKASEVKIGLEAALNKKDDFKGYDNFLIAKYLYEHSEDIVDLIATAFSESPFYGDKDLAKSFKGRSFTRITSSDLCDDNLAEKIIKSLGLSNASIVTIPFETEIARINGMFIKYNDNSYLAFIALPAPGGNVGRILIQDAKGFFDYYASMKSAA